MGLFKNSFFYSILNVLRKAVSFFLLPVYLIYLSPEDYGIISVITSIVSVLVIIFGLSLKSSVSRFYYVYYEKDPEYLKQLWGTCLYIVTIVSITGTLLLFLLSDLLLAPILVDIAIYPYMVIAFGTVLFQPIYQLFQVSLKAQQKAKQSTIFDLSFFVLNISLTLVFIIVFDLKAEGVLIAQSTTNLIFCGLALVNLVPQVDFTYNKRALKEIFNYSLPLLPHSLSTWVMNMMDRVLLNKFISTSSVGIYNVGFQIANLLNLLILGFAEAFYPWLYQQYEKKSTANVEEIGELSIKVVVLIAMIISLFTPELFSILSIFKGIDQQYFEAASIIPYLVFSFVFQGVYTFTSSPAYLHNTKLIFLVTSIGAIINILLNLFVIPRYGMHGAAVTAIVQRLVVSLIFRIFWAQENFYFSYFTMFLLPLVLFGMTLFVLENFEMISITNFFVKLIFLTITSLTILYKQKALILSFKENLLSRAIKKHG